MNLLTEFLTTYDELSVFNDIDIADTADSQWLSRAELDSTLVTKANEWQSAVASRFRGRIVSQGIIQFFAPQNQQETTIEPLARQCKGALARWHSNAVKASLSSFNERTDNPDYKINLHGSWYGYCFGLDFSVKDPQQKQQLVIDCVKTSARYFEVDESDILLYTAKVQQSSMYIICVKHDNSANKSTLDKAPIAFNLTRKYIEYSTLTPSNGVGGVMEKSLASDSLSLENIKAFLTEYNNYKATGELYKAQPLAGLASAEEIKELTPQSLKEFFNRIAFHAPSLAKYYQEQCQNNPDQAATIADVIKTFYHCHISGPKSFQYLANAIIQEKTIVKEGKGILKYNDTATNASSAQAEYAHEYLVSTNVTPDSDFVYIGNGNRDQDLTNFVNSLNGTSFTRFTLQDVTNTPVTEKQYDEQDDKKDTTLDQNSIDAKIFNSLASWQDHCGKASVTKAYYIIMNIKDTSEWYLFRQNAKRTGWVPLAGPNESNVV